MLKAISIIVLGLVYFWRGINVLIKRKYISSELFEGILYSILFFDIFFYPYDSIDTTSIIFVGILIIILFFQLGRIKLDGFNEEEFVEYFKNILEEKNIEYKHYTGKEKLFFLNRKYEVKYKYFFGNITIDFRKLFRTELYNDLKSELYNDLKTDIDFQLDLSKIKFSWVSLRLIMLGFLFLLYSFYQLTSILS